MNNFPIKKLALGIIIALGLSTTAPTYAAGKEKVTIKIAPTKGSIATDKNAKKFVKGVAWTPCIAATTSYALGPIALTVDENTAKKTITVVPGKISADDSLTFVLDANDVSETNPVYFYLVDPSGQSTWDSAPFSTLVFSGDSGAIKTPLTDALTIVPATNYFSVGTSGKVKATLNFPFDSGSISAAQGTWTAVAFIAPKSKTAAELVDPKNWLASAIQPFILGNPFYNGADCGTGGGGGTTAVAINLDTRNPAGTIQEPATFNAGAAAYAFTDAQATSNYIRISGFGADDSLAFDWTAANVTFGNEGADVVITVNNNGIVSQVVLVDVTTPSALIYDLTTFNALPVGDLTLSN